MSHQYLEHHPSIKTDITDEDMLLLQIDMALDARDGGIGLIRAKEQKRVLLDDVDIDWVLSEQETDVFRAMWEADRSVDSIAEELGRKHLEIGLLIIEQAELGEIQVRQQRIFGQ